MTPSDSTEWPPYDLILLSRSVSLQLQSDDADGDGIDSAAQHKSRSTVQIAITLLCLGLCYYLLTSDSSDTSQPTKSLKYGFADLVQQLESEAPSNNAATAAEGASPAPQTSRDLRKLPYERRTILTYLTDAGVADTRWGKTKIDPERAIKAYQLLLSYRPVRNATSGGDSVESRIKEYATVRSADLATLVK